MAAADPHAAGDASEQFDSTELQDEYLTEDAPEREAKEDFCKLAFDCCIPACHCRFRLPRRSRAESPGSQFQLAAACCLLDRHELPRAREAQVRPSKFMFGRACPVSCHSVQRPVRCHLCSGSHDVQNGDFYCPEQKATVALGAGELRDRHCGSVLFVNNSAGPALCGLFGWLNHNVGSDDWVRLSSSVVACCCSLQLCQNVLAASFLHADHPEMDLVLPDGVRTAWASYLGRAPDLGSSPSARASGWSGVVAPDAARARLRWHLCGGQAGSQRALAGHYRAVLPRQRAVCSGLDVSS
jgi:hypothetical protein